MHQRKVLRRYAHRACALNTIMIDQADRDGNGLRRLTLDDALRILHGLLLLRRAQSKKSIRKAVLLQVVRSKKIISRLLRLLLLLRQVLVVLLLLQPALLIRLAKQQFGEQMIALQLRKLSVALLSATQQ